MFSTVPSSICATSRTSAPAMGWPAGSKSRRAYDSPHPSDTGWRTSSTRGEPANRGGVAFGVAASVGGALVPGPRDVAPVTFGAVLVSRGVAGSLSAARGGTDFVFAGPPAEGDSLDGRAGGGVSVRAR